MLLSNVKLNLDLSKCFKLCTNLIMLISFLSRRALSDMSGCLGSKCGYLMFKYKCSQDLCNKKVLLSILKLEQDEIIIAQVVKELISVRDGMCFISNLEISYVMSVIYDLCVN